MQKQLNDVQEFRAWCGMQINVKKTYSFITNNDKKRREQEPEPLVTINHQEKLFQRWILMTRADIWDIGYGKRRYESNQGSGQAKDRCNTWLIKYHPLTPELETELFTCKCMGVFCFLAALIDWSDINWTTSNDCASKPTRTLGNCHVQQQVLSLSLRKYTQVRKAQCPWQYWHRSWCCMPRDACDMRMGLKKSCWQA